MKKTSQFDYETLVRYMLPKGILDAFEITKVEEEWAQVKNSVDSPRERGLTENSANTI